MIPTWVTPTVGAKSIADHASAVNPAWLKANGIEATCCYIDGSLQAGRPSWKSITPERAFWIHAAGVGLALCFEQTADEWRGGYRRGLRNGQFAAADIKVINYPADAIVFATYDQDVTPADELAAVGYWRGFVDGLDGACLAGAYGDKEVFDALGRLTGKYTCHGFWQASASWWSKVSVGGKWVFPTHPLAHVRQHTSIATPSGRIDPNTAIRPLRFWTGYAPDPEPDPLEDDMLPIIYIVEGANAAFITISNTPGLMGIPTIHVQWSGPGSDPKVAALLAGLRSSGSPTRTVPLSACKSWTLHGPLPVGDTRRKWALSDFCFAV